jgi:hypothetical protein
MVEEQKGKPLDEPRGLDFNKPLIGDRVKMVPDRFQLRNQVWLLVVQYLQNDVRFVGGEGPGCAPKKGRLMPFDVHFDDQTAIDRSLFKIIV